ncbi:MAG: GNAT family N-acetyltransferase [Pseudomonadota bacterium]
MSTRLRAARPGDFGRILALNEESVRFLSPLDNAALAALHAEAAWHRVLEADTGIEAFLLAFAEGASYASPNYRWFDAHYERFLYVDRVVVCGTARRRGHGDHLYADLFAHAREQDVPVVTCEIDVVPPNPGSVAFHDRFGFVEVGQQAVQDGRKTVSLRAAEVPVD